jgi:hypothetical protein
MRALVLAAAALFLTSGAALADQEVTHHFSTASARGSAHRVVVDITAGEIEVRNGAADRISVHGEIRRSFDGWRQRDKQQAMANDISVEVVLRGEDAIVRRKFGPNAQSWSAKSHHTNVTAIIEVPPGFDVDIGTRYGEVHIDGSFGNIDTDLRAGEISVRTPRANVREVNATVRIGDVHSNLGHVFEEHEGVFPGGTHWVNTGGAGRSNVTVHTTVGEVNITLTQ